jgi:hypothetical protein
MDQQIPTPPKPGREEENQQDQEKVRMLSEKMMDHYNYLKNEIPKLMNQGQSNEAHQGNGQTNILEQLIPEVRKYEEQIGALNQILEQIAGQLESYAGDIKNAIGGE